MFRVVLRMCQSMPTWSQPCTRPASGLSLTSRSWLASILSECTVRLKRWTWSCKWWKNSYLSNACYFSFFFYTLDSKNCRPSIGTIVTTSLIKNTVQNDRTSKKKTCNSPFSLIRRGESQIFILERVIDLKKKN